jgi:hypothetical protein
LADIVRRFNHSFPDDERCQYYLLAHYLEWQPYNLLADHIRRCDDHSMVYYLYYSHLYNHDLEGDYDQYAFDYNKHDPDGDYDHHAFVYYDKHCLDGDYDQYAYVYHNKHDACGDIDQPYDNNVVGNNLFYNHKSWFHIDHQFSIDKQRRNNACRIYDLSHVCGVVDNL